MSKTIGHHLHDVIEMSTVTNLSFTYALIRPNIARKDKEREWRHLCTEDLRAQEDERMLQNPIPVGRRPPESFLGHRMEILIPR